MEVLFLFFFLWMRKDQGFYIIYPGCPAIIVHKARAVASPTQTSLKIDMKTVMKWGNTEIIVGDSEERKTKIDQ